jgi:nucleotide-binding universal stress UspA family protein
MSTVFHNLLLATERTEFDAGAEHLALALAGRCGAPLGVVMPLHSNPEFESAAPSRAERAEREAAARLARLRQQAEEAGIGIDLRVRRGAELWREIVDEARERGSDLLILRRRGRRGFLAQLLVGEMVGQVLAHAPCCVLVVPHDARMWSSRVLVAAEAGQQGLRQAALGVSVASACALPLSVVCVARPGDAPRRAAAAFLAQAQGLATAAGVAARTELRGGAAPAELLTAAREHAADLIVLGAGHARRGGVAYEVTGAAACPVLLVPGAPSSKEPPR